MKIIVGLGNPGLRYRNTRHNAGFMVVSALAGKYRIAVKKRGFGGRYGVGKIGPSEVLLFEPLTYMNLSGPAVKAVCSTHLRDMEDLLVVSDDLNLDLGRMRLRDKGSDGGHNGLKSIIGVMGDGFSRLRLGVGMGMVPEDMPSFVLSPFARKDQKPLREMIERAVEGIEMWLDLGTRDAMRRVNSPL